MIPAALTPLIEQALARLRASVQQRMPHAAPQIVAWIEQLAAPAAPAAYFQHPLAFPALLLPWWLEATLRPAPDPAFQTDLCYSTVNGYYAIRLIDNLMDGHATVELQLLPALHLFSTQFQGVYRRYFEGTHPFWGLFEQTWLHTADVSLHDAQLPSLTRPQFEAIAAHKVAAAIIPLAAVAYRHHRPDTLPAWAQFVDRFGCWHQMFNDLFDWPKDLRRGTVTYFLSEAQRRREPAETTAGWVAREGFAWGIAQLEGWLADTQTVAAGLESAALVEYLAQRERLLRQRQAQAESALPALARLVKAKL